MCVNVYGPFHIDGLIGSACQFFRRTIHCSLWSGGCQWTYLCLHLTASDLILCAKNRWMGIPICLVDRIG